MSDLVKSLKKMGWSDELISHYVDREFTDVETSSLSVLRPECTDAGNLTITNSEKITTNTLIIK